MKPGPHGGISRPYGRGYRDVPVLVSLAASICYLYNSDNESIPDPFLFLFPVYLNYHSQHLQHLNALVYVTRHRAGAVQGEPREMFPLGDVIWIANGASKHTLAPQLKPKKQIYDILDDFVKARGNRINELSGLLNPN